MKMSKICELSSEDAKNILLHPDAYCNFNMPPYFNHKTLLEAAETIVNTPNYTSGIKPSSLESINHTLIANKDGAYSWRPLQLVHPVKYVEIVNEITKPDNWILIKSKFEEFSSDPKIEAINIPKDTDVRRESTERIINNWWDQIEQQTVQLSLDFSYLSTADISDCYGSIYTHTVSWALHTKTEAKKPENRGNSAKAKAMLGNKIDNFMQDMHNRQTNGIPQGNMISDLVAELILGYADDQLSTALKKSKIIDYKILRYRDDYRIFTNSKKEGELILLYLTNVLADLNLKLNPQKTGTTGDIISSSMRADKLSWIQSSTTSEGFLRSIIKIREFSKEYPNSGSLIRLLSDYRKRLEGVVVRPAQNISMIAILVDIMLSSPRVYPTGASVLAKLLSFEKKPDSRRLFKKIKNRFKDTPNIGDLDIWLQRINIRTNRNQSYDEPLCQLVSDKISTVWNSAWLATNAKEKLDSCKFIDEDIIAELDDVPSVPETELYVRKKSPDYAMESIK